MSFWSKLFDTSDFPPRWFCGDWTDGHGWLHIGSDLAIWAAYFSIPAALLFFSFYKRNLPFRGIFVLFGAFILCCGTTHLMEAAIFWWPAYRFAGILKLITALVSWATVIMLLRLSPEILAMRTGADFEAELDRRTEQLHERTEQLRQEREWFSTTLTSIGDAVITTDTEGRVTLINQIAADLTGWDQPAARGKPLAEVFAIINESTREKVKNPVHEALASGVIVGLANHTLLIRRDGTEVPIDDSAAPIRSGDGQLVGAVLVFRDISKRKAIEDELRQREQQFNQLANALPQLAWMADPRGNIDWYNDRWYQYTGTTLEEMRGWGWEKVHDPEVLPTVVDQWKAALASGETFSMVFPLRGADGQFRPFLTRVVPFCNDDGEIIRWFGTNTDIGDLTEAQEELRIARSRLETTLSAAEIGTWELDLRTREVFADDNLNRIFDLDPKPPAALVDNYLQKIHPEDRPGVLESIEQSIRCGDAFRSEYRIVKPDGAYRWVLARGRVECDEAGGAVRLPGLVVDITEQKVAIAAQKESEVRLQLALDAAEMGTWEISENMELITDGQFRQLFELPEDAGYEEALAMIHPEDRQTVLDQIEAATRPIDPIPYSCEYRVVRPDKIERWIFARGLSTFQGTGEGRRLEHFNGIVADVTRQRRLREDLRLAADRLADADRRKDEFLATLAHELRNPLAPIRTGLQVLQQSDELAAAHRDVVETMQRQTDQMVHLIDDLLDVSRITRGKLSLRLKHVDFRDVARGGVEAARPVIDQNNHTLNVSLPTDPVFVRGDPTRLTQIVTNLLNNAAKYTPPGGKIDLQLTTGDDHAVLQVSDNGLGIPASMRDSIFDLFKQIDRSAEGTYTGLGIGLTLVKTLLDMHGGEISVQSEGAGRGSTFIIRVPSLKQATESMTTDDPAAQTEPPPRAIRRGLRVLIVDDNAAAARMLQIVVKSTGAAAQTASDGLEAIEVAETFGPEVILMDLGMPKMNGYEAAAHIRAQDWGRSIRLVALSGWGQESDKQRTAEVGFDAHLVKPADADTLRRLLADASGPAAPDPAADSQ